MNLGRPYDGRLRWSRFDDDLWKRQGTVAFGSRHTDRRDQQNCSVCGETSQHL
jgi:hypothetical protein